MYDREESERLANRLERYRRLIHKDKSLQLTLVTPSGLKANEYSWNVQAVIDLDDLFRC